MATPTDPAMTPMRILDAASMLRKRVNQNERPFTKAMLLNNNAIVDEWYAKVLTKIADAQGSVRAGQVWSEWQYFYNSKLVPPFIQAIEEGHVCRPDPVAVEYWVRVFSKAPIEELAKMGPAVVGHGWKLVVDETYIRKMLAKWEKVYSGTNDPLVWRKLANDYPKLWNVDGESPFWSAEELPDITQKVMSVLKVGILPDR